MSNELTEEEYDALYDQGFDEGVVDNPSTEDEYLEESPDEAVKEEEVEQPVEMESDDEDVEPDEDNDTESDEEVEDSKPFLTFERKGQTYNLTADEARILASKGFDYTAKTQDLAARRRTLEIIDGMSDEELTTWKDAKQGNKDALAKVINDLGVDPYDIETETNYVPEVVDKNYELEDIVTEINSNPDIAAKMDSWVKDMPNSVETYLGNNLDVLKGLHIDATAGIADQIMPEVIKQINMNPSLDFKDTYISVGTRMMNTKVPEKKPEASIEARKKASISKAKTNTKINDHKDIWEDDELYKKMQQMRRHV